MLSAIGVRFSTRLSSDKQTQAARLTGDRASLKLYRAAKLRGEVGFVPL